MNLQPYQKFEIVTALSPYDAEAALMNKVTPYAPTGVFSINIDKRFLFQGGFSNGKFRLKPNRYLERSAFIPLAFVLIEPVGSGSKLRVKVLLASKVIVVCLASALVETVIAYSAILSGQWPLIALALALPPFVYGFIVFMVYYEAVDFKTNLLKIFGETH